MSARLKNRKVQRAQKRRINLNFSLKGVPFRGKKIFLYFSLAFCFAFIFYITSLFAKTRFWNGKEKVALAVRSNDGASVLLFDPHYDELVTLYIPEHTEIEAAKQLGRWKIESIWELGQQEGESGKLLADSITKYFKFPVSAWADSQASGFGIGGVRNIMKAGFGSYATNLTLGDRARMAWFAFRLPNTKHIDIHLENSGYLQKGTLSDGTPGYRKVEPPPQDILALFTDETFGKSTYAIAIQDATGQTQVARNVGSVVEVLGAKVVAVDREETQDIDCIVKGSNAFLINRIAKLFNCKEEKAESNFDLEILLGTQFARRF